MAWAVIVGSVPSVLPVAAQEAPAWSRAATEDTRVRLFVRGDDFGYTHASNAALARALETGLMRSASVLVTGPWVRETAAMLRERPEMSVGVHLAVTSEWNRLRWSPISPAGAVPSLVAADGAFFKNFRGLDPSVIRRLAAMRPADRREMEAIIGTAPPAVAEVAVEVRAQVERARALGLRVDYLDCHMGAVCEGALRPVLIELAAELCLPIPELGWMAHEEIGISWSGSFEQDEAALDTLLRGLRPGLYRLVVHPAEISDELRSVDTLAGGEEAARRHSQLLALESPRIRRAVADARIELVGISGLWDYTNCRLK